MKLSTGKVAFPIEFDNGDKDCIYFNPNDPDFAVRLCEYKDRIFKELSKIENIDLNTSGNPANDLKIEEFKKVKNIICRELDRAFDANISEVVFKHCSPFAIVGGDYYIVNFIEAIMPEVEKHIKKSKAEIEKKMKKHLEKYNI